jgi:hypothetical protein
VTPTAAILALALSTRPPLALTVEAERVSLPAGATPVRLEPRPFVLEWVLHVPPAAAPSLARRLSGTSRLCPKVKAAEGQVVLHCVTSLLRAALVATPSGTVLDLHRLKVPPWRPEEEGPPLVPFDVGLLRLGSCPGKTLELQGECALAAGDLGAARARFAEAVRAGPAPLAELRLGDLALRDDDPDAAVAHWRRARAEAPWGRLAAARICELAPACLASRELNAIYDRLAVEWPLAPDLVLRRARIMAFAGDLLDAARLVAGESGFNGACAGAPAWCRRLVLTALGRPPPDGAEALAVYLDMPGRREGPLALELVRAATLQAERAGAPIFAANLLGSATGKVPAPELEEHLRRVAALYLDGGDRVRAEEIVRFARSRLGEAALRAPEWRAMRRAVRVPRGRAAPPRGAPPSSPDPELSAARSALDAARLAQPKGERP